ncbi:RcpC/CpaB family pilus assembly protein [Streptomyces sp. NPDC059247]|uniref:RcpC/CpaB family pilus assembly protein n=1 Tax=Streptomyces sp. NPDC059247 TaxID=3346790 RepID=UPI0036988264
MTNPNHTPGHPGHLGHLGHPTYENGTRPPQHRMYEDGTRDPERQTHERPRSGPYCTDSGTRHPWDETPGPSPVPEPYAVPAFEPVHVRNARHRLRRALRRARHAPAALLALTAAALLVTDGRTAPPPHETPTATVAARARPPAAAPPVSVPVRIADAATARLLRPGDRIDVIAAPHPALGGGTPARMVARGVRVAEVPPPDATGPDAGALVVLSVPRPTAAELAGAGTASQLAVILW